MTIDCNEWILAALIFAAVLNKLIDRKYGSWS